MDNTDRFIIIVIILEDRCVPFSKSIHGIFKKRREKDYHDETHKCESEIPRGENNGSAMDFDAKPAMSYNRQ